jgi:hypothetical protein
VPQWFVGAGCFHIAGGSPERILGRSGVPGAQPKQVDRAVLVVGFGLRDLGGVPDADTSWASVPEYGHRVARELFYGYDCRCPLHHFSSRTAGVGFGLGGRSRCRRDCYHYRGHSAIVRVPARLGLPPEAFLSPTGGPGSDGSQPGQSPTCRKPFPTPGNGRSEPG